MLAAEGFIGMTWPATFGGGGRPAIERIIMAEEMISAGAPHRGQLVRRPPDGPVHLQPTAPMPRRPISCPGCCRARRHGASG